MRWVVTLWALVAAGSVAAEPCALLGDFIDGALEDLPRAACRTTLTQTGPARACSWAFPYRSPEVYAAFEAQIATFEACIPSASPAPIPKGVNHPDSHDVRIYAMGADRVTISLKDKAGLGQSLVFFIVDFGAIQS